MSTTYSEEIFGIGKRLREERERLGLSQVALASRLLTTDRTVKKYEGNETSPRATELLTLFGLGADVTYIITGIRTPFSVAEGRSAYTPAERLAVSIADLKLSEDDAATLKTLAERLAR